MRQNLKETLQRMICGNKQKPGGGEHEMDLKDLWKQFCRKIIVTPNV
jgi:hypothetical protein